MKQSFFILALLSAAAFADISESNGIEILGHKEDPVAREAIRTIKELVADSRDPVAARLMERELELVLRPDSAERGNVADKREPVLCVADKRNPVLCGEHGSGAKLNLADFVSDYTFVKFEKSIYQLCLSKPEKISDK